MIKAKDFIASCQEALDQHFGYIWGKKGQVWTQKQQDRATREQTVKWGQQWVGRPVTDCSGLIVRAYEAFGHKIYHGSNTMWNKYLSAKGDVLNGVAIKPGAAMFQVDERGVRHHVGVHKGSGVVIEARGTKKGVIASLVADWDEWGELKDVDYTDAGESYIVVKPRDTLRRGNRGELVRQLQAALIALGYDVGDKGADGVFGKATQAAVERFQADNSLDVDGVVGGDTWAALDAAQGKDDGHDTMFVVTVIGLNGDEADTVISTWGNRAKKEVMA